MTRIFSIIVLALVGYLAYSAASGLNSGVRNTQARISGHVAEINAAMGEPAAK